MAFTEASEIAAAGRTQQVHLPAEDGAGTLHSAVLYIPSMTGL